ncbi:MAG: response regulator [Polyangiaceae bacterium]|nr:response regulator [Polyangiaceae bacterium]
MNPSRTSMGPPNTSKRQSLGPTVPPERPPAQRGADSRTSLRDSDLAEAQYDLVRGTAGGLLLVYTAFSVFHLFELGSPGTHLVIVLDQPVILASALAFWLMKTRRIPLGWANPITVLLGLLVASNTAGSVLLTGECGDLRYMQAVAIGGGAIALSGRALGVLLVGTAAMAVPVATCVCSTAELMDFCVMQIATSLFSVALSYGRIQGQRRLLSVSQRAKQAAEDLGRALARAEYEFAEHQRSDQKRRELEEQLRQAQKLEALGTLAGGVAHDMNNVLGAISATASEAIESMEPNSPARQELSEILTAARRGATLTQNILSFARRVPAEAIPVRVDTVLSEVEVLLKRTLPKRVAVNVAPDAAEHWIDADAGQVGHLVMNLCLNSADAIAGFGHILVTTREIELDEELGRRFGVAPGTYVELAVTDDGRGIPADYLPRVFEPYFSTKTELGRSGLGLSMVYGTVQEHRGGITIRSVEGRGTTVTVVFPSRPRPVSVAPRAKQQPEVDGARNGLLVVDDEPLLRRAGRRIGESLGFEVLTASNGREALEVFADHRARIGAVVLDVAMPVMSGEECFRELRRQAPDLPIVLTTGFAKNQDIQALLTEGNTRYLRKPYEKNDLAEVLSQMLGGRERPSLAALRAE